MTARFEAETDAIELVDLLCFDIGAERFAVVLSTVDEVIDASALDAQFERGTVRGVIRLGDEMLPVHDAESVLQVQHCASEPMGLVFSAGNSRLVVLVDYAEAAVGVSVEGLRSPSKIISRDHVLTGAVKVGSRWVGYLNTGAFVEALIHSQLPEPVHGR